MLCFIDMEIRPININGLLEHRHKRKQTARAFHDKSVLWEQKQLIHALGQARNLRMLRTSKLWVQALGKLYLERHIDEVLFWKYNILQELMQRSEE